MDKKGIRNGPTYDPVLGPVGPHQYWVYPHMNLIHYRGSLYCFHAFLRGEYRIHSETGGTFMRKLVMVQNYSRRWAFVQMCRRRLARIIVRGLADDMLAMCLD